MVKILIILFVLLVLLGCSHNKIILNEKPQKVEIINNTIDKDEIIDLGNDWFQVTTSEIIYPNITEEEVREIAINKACKIVIDYYRGVLVKSRTLNIQSENNNEILIDHFSRIINISSEAIILEKKIINEEKIIFGNSIKLIITIKVKVGEQKGESDLEFKINAELNKAHFSEGEKLQISILPTKDCYLTIFCLYSNETISMLLPNRNKENNFAKAGKMFVFPEKRDGFSIALELLPGKNDDSEVIIILATKQKVSFPSFKTLSTYNTFEASLKELMYQLSEIPRSEMEEITIPYYIHK